MPETMGGGVGVLDYDNDGDQDIVMVRGTTWPDDPAPHHAPTSIGLFENDGHGRFEDVSARLGLSDKFYGLGIAIGDIDGDGFRDLYFTALGRNRLYRNLGDRFVEVTDAAGVSGDASDFLTSAGFFDYDLWRP